MGRRRAPEHEEEALQVGTARPRTVSRDDGFHQRDGVFPASPASLTSLQRQAGNTAVADLVGAPGHGRAVLQRLVKPRSTGAAIGSDPRTVTFVPGGVGQEDKTLALGQQGFTRQMLGMHGDASVKAAKTYEGVHLTPVTAHTADLDSAIAIRAEQQVVSTDKSTGKGEFWGAPPPSARREYEKRAADAGAHAAELAGLRSDQEEKVATFNAWVPRANATYLSLGRLEGMQGLLGVSDPEQMVEALMTSLKSAGGIASRAPAGVDLPAANAQVTAGHEMVTLASRKMHTAWLGYQETLVRDRMKAIAQLGEKDEKRLKEINETIEGWEKIGKTVDFSLEVMSGYGALEGAGASFAVDQFSGELKNMPSDVGAKGKALGKTVAGGIGIPTSVGGLLKGIAGLAYEGEILKIEKQLAVLKGQVSAHSQVADALGIRGKVEAFENAVAEYKQWGGELQRRVVDRQMSYLKMGQQIDAASRTDVVARKEGVAAAPGKERFTTVMLLTAQVREVLALARGAASGFDQPKALESWVYGYKVTRSRHVYGHGSLPRVPDAELQPLGEMLVQVRQFHVNVAELTRVLGQVDTQAGSVMKALGGGQEEFSAY